MAHTVRTSWKDLGLLFMLVGMGMLVFGSLLYYIENNEPETSYVSIPDGMWWAVQTLTSLGYGDYWPGKRLRKGIKTKKKGEFSSDFGINSNQCSTCISII